MASYLRPRALSEAVAALNEVPRVIVAGATDYYPTRVGRAIDEDVLDITAIDGLRGVSEDGAWHRIGALTTWTDLLQADLPPWFDGLKLAAREVGGVQIQNTGTLAGNLCNASPAADGTPNLMALDAVVELMSARGTRRLLVEEFITGNRTTRRERHELVTAVLVPRPGPGTRGTFLKLGSRAYLAISIVMVAATLTPAADGTTRSARVSVGACSAVPRRLTALEGALEGRPIDAGLAAVVDPAHLSELEPIDDVRATADYRREAALVLVRRTLERLAAEVAG